MSQLGTDHIAASLLDDLDEKVQQLEVGDSAKQVIPLESNDLESPPKETLNPYVNIEINPTIQLVEVKREGKLSQLLKKTPLQKSSDCTSPPHEVETHISGGESSPDASVPEKIERTSSETDKELSRSLGNKTRLPTLPPKDPAEERKHLAQFQEMMVAAKQRELAKAAEAEKARVAKEEDMHRLTRLWSNDIIPNWGKPGVASRAGKIIAKGIPSSCRGQVWSRCLENQSKGGRPSALTSETYEFLLQRAYHPPAPYRTMTQRNAKLIAHDAAGVFPDLGLFGPGIEADQGKASEPGPYYTSLLNVINAHASLAPTEPYENRAIGSLAGVLLLHMDEQDAFLALQGLLCRPMHAAFALTTPQASSYLKAFDLAFSEKHPRLYKHFQHAQLKSEMFLSSWIANLFTKHLSLEACCHIWDLYLVAGERGDEIIFLVALVMLGWLEPHLYGRLDEALGYLGQPVPLTLDYLIARLPTNSNSPNPLAAVISTSTSSLMSFSLPKSVVNALKDARAESEKSS